MEKYGADAFGIMSDSRQVQIAFTFDGINCVIRIPRVENAADDRQQWRALVLVVKAKLEAIECGFTTFEDEFLATVIMKNGQTVGEYARPQLQGLSMGDSLRLLPAPSDQSTTKHERKRG